MWGPETKAPDVDLTVSWTRVIVACRSQQQSLRYALSCVCLCLVWNRNWSVPRCPNPKPLSETIIVIRPILVNILNPPAPDLLTLSALIACNPNLIICMNLIQTNESRYYICIHCPNLVICQSCWAYKPLLWTEPDPFCITRCLNLKPLPEPWSETKPCHSPGPCLYPESVWTIRTINMVLT